MRNTERLAFDRFEVDLQRRRLTRSGRTMRIQPQPFAVLDILLARAGEIVPREELRRGLWSTSTHVEFDTGLNTAVRKLRRALGDSADSARFIQTVPGVGYRFIAVVERVADPQTRMSETVVPDRPIARRFPISRHIGLAAVVVISILAGPSTWTGEWRRDASVGHARFAASDYQSAVVAFARAVKAGADDESVFVEYACALAHLKQHDLALRAVERGLARRPRSVILRANRGLYLHAVGRYDEELAALTDAVAIDPRSADAQFHLGLGFARRSDYGASLSALRRAVDLSGGAPRFLSWLGRIAADAGRIDQAESALRQLRQRAATEHVPADLINSVAFHLSVASRS